MGGVPATVASRRRGRGDRWRGRDPGMQGEGEVRRGSQRPAAWGAIEVWDGEGDVGRQRRPAGPLPRSQEGGGVRAA
nr:unnamed protein product [Digitaria exilis]